MTSNRHAPRALGYTHATMAGTEGRQAARWSQSQKTDRSPDRTLQLGCVKLESLVITYQNDVVNTFPGLVHTARHITKVGCTRSRDPNRKEGSAQGMTHDWGEVVTR